MNRHSAIIAIGLGVLILVSAASAYGQVITVGGTRKGVHASQTWTIHQGSLPFANDYHVKIWQKEDNIDINGWKITFSCFDTAYSQRGSQPPPYNSEDNGRHAVDAMFWSETNSIPNCTYCTLKAELWLTDWNTVRKANEIWTYDTLGTTDTSESGIPDIGWTVSDPVLGAQANELDHRFILYNDDTLQSLTLIGDLVFGFARERYDIDPLQLPVVATDTVPGDTTLGPGDSLVAVLTSTIYRDQVYDNFLYGHFEVANVVSAQPSQFTIEHQIDPLPGTPALTNWGILILLLMIILSAAYILYRRRQPART